MNNYTAFLTLIGDINNAFCHLDEDNTADICNICDGDMKLLDKAQNKKVQVRQIMMKTREKMEMRILIQL